MLLLRALRWRAAASAATLLLAAVTVLAAVVGPLWTRAAGESLLQDALRTAAPGDNAALGEVTGVPTTRLLERLDRAVQATDLPHHGAPLRGMRLVSLVDDGDRGVEAPVLWREGFCEQVVLVAGRCPSRPGEVLLHRLQSGRPGFKGQAQLDALVRGDAANRPALATRVTVVGSYVPRDPDGDYWTGEDSAFVSAPGQGDTGPDRGQALLTVAATFDAIADQYPTRPRPLGQATSTRLLDVPGIRLDQVPALTAAVARAKQSLELATTASGSVELRDHVGDQLDAAAARRHDLRRATTVVLAQLVLLAGAVLLLVVTASAAARGPEVAAARLHGLPPRTVVALAIGEPLLLVAVATPVGALLAWVLVRALTAARLLDGTPVVVSAGAVQVLLVAFVAVVVAVLLACARSLGRPVLDLWRRTSAPVSRGALGRDLALAVVAAAAAVLCARRGQPWVLLVPVPAGLAVALLGVRLLPLVLGPSLRRTRARRGLAWFLALRQVVRRREGGLLVALLVVAFGLAGTGVTAWSVTGRATQVRADADIGAARVLRVQPDPQHPDLDLRQAVRAADPGGRRAMAVQDYLPFHGEPGGRYLAVDSTRLAAVARWEAGYVGAPVAAVVRALEPSQGGPPPAVVTSAVGGTGIAEVTSIDGRPQQVSVQRVVRSLPRALSKATIVDWDSTPHLATASVVALSEVWLADDDPALVRAIEAQGLQVLATEDADERRALLDRQGPALSVLLALVAAVLGVLLAVATTVFTLLTGARRRGWEAAALGALGVPARALRASARQEAAVLLGSGLVLGAVAAAAGSALMLPYLPLLATDATGYRVPLVPDVLPLLLLLLAAVAAAAATAALAGRVLLRAADPSRLREVQA